MSMFPPGLRAVVSVAVVEPLPCMRAGIALMLERSDRYRVMLSLDAVQRA